MPDRDRPEERRSIIETQRQGHRALSLERGLLAEHIDTSRKICTGLLASNLAEPGCLRAAASSRHRFMAHADHENPVMASPTEWADVFLDQVGPEETRYDATVKRAIAFRDAGADCVFVPGLSDPAIIGRLVKDVQCPVNILVGPGSPTVAALEELGVARISVGSALMRATLGAVRRAADELRTSGTYGGLEGGIAYGEVNELLRNQHLEV